MKNAVKGTLGAGAILWWASLGADYLRDTHLWETAGEIAGITHGIVGSINNVIEKWVELVENVPFVGDAAPFAFPVIAGAKWAHILADKMFDKERKVLRGLTTIAWWALGWLASMSVVGKYLTVAGLWYTAWKSPKVIEWLARKWLAFPVQWAKWIGDGWKRWKNATFAKTWKNEEWWIFA